MVLLPWAAREELRRLLAYMRAVSQDQSIALHPKETNEVIVLREFSDSIFRQKVTAPSLCCTLAQFLLHHLDEVFHVPPSVEDKVNQRLDLLRQGCSAPVADAAYCSRVSMEEMKKQAEKTTEMEVVALMNTIINDSNFTAKDKRQKLKQFQKCHPAMFQKHFADMLD